MITAKNIGIAALAVGCILGVLSFLGVSLGHGSSFGAINNGAAVQNYPFWFTNGAYAGSQQQLSVNSSGQLKLGTNGTALTTIINGTCNASTTGLPLAASSSAVFTCTATGAASGMNATIDLAANPTSYGSFIATSPIVSANTITFTIENLTGAATSSFPLATTSVMYTLTQ